MTTLGPMTLDKAIFLRYSGRSPRCDKSLHVSVTKQVQIPDCVSPRDWIARYSQAQSPATCEGVVLVKGDETYPYHGTSRILQ